MDRQGKARQGKAMLGKARDGREWSEASEREKGGREATTKVVAKALYML